MREICLQRITFNDRTKRAVKVSDSTSHTDTISQQISKNDLKVQGIAGSEDALVKKSAVKKSPPNLSVKRKAIEVVFLRRSNLFTLITTHMRFI